MIRRKRVFYSAAAALLFLSLVGLIWRFSFQFAGPKIRPDQLSAIQFARWGSEKQPLTDVEQISDLVDQIDAALMAALAQDKEWVLLRDQLIVPPELKPTGTMRALYPDETMIREQWYLLDENGLVRKSAVQFIDQQGVPRLEWIVVNGQRLDLTLYTPTSLQEGMGLPLPTGMTQQRMMLALENQRPVEAKIVVRDGQSVWQLVIDEVYEESVPLDRPGRTAAAKRVTFLFSWPELRPLSRQVDLLLDDDSWLTAEVTIHEVMQRVDSLPPAVADLLRRGTRQIDNPNMPARRSFAEVDPRSIGAPPPLWSAATIVEASRHGLTISAKEVEASSQEITIGLIIEVDDRWPLNPVAFPLQQVGPRPKQMQSATGRWISPRSTTGGLLWFDADSDMFVSQTSVTYEGLDADVASITAPIDLVVEGLFLPERLVIDLADRQVGDSWQPDIALTVGRDQLTVSEVALLDRSVTEVEIELLFEPLSDEDVIIQCLGLWKMFPEGLDCQKYSGSLRAVMVIDEEQPSQTEAYWLKANVSFHEPWTITIPVEP